MAGSDSPSMSAVTKRRMVLSPVWMQGIVVSFIIGFGILGYLTVRVYRDHPPIPSRTVTESGKTVFTAEDVRSGQELFLTYGLMQYGSIYGHGAYLGPDFTADYLHRQAVEMLKAYGGGSAAAERVRRELQANRYDPATDVLTWTDVRAQAFDALTDHYRTEVLDREKSGAAGSARTPSRIRTSRAGSSHSSRGPPGQHPRDAPGNPTRTRTTGRPKSSSGIS